MLLELKNVKKSFPSPAGEQDVQILNDVNLSVSEGESIAIVGPSGSGKSTLLNLIGALDKPSSGEVLLNDKNLADLNDKELAQTRNQEIGFVFQLHHLLPQCTVLENVLIPTLPGYAKKNDYEQKAKELLDKLGLGNHLYHSPSLLSGGEQQRVAVVRALINGPKLLLADEPTGSLDQKSSDNLAEVLASLNKEGVALVTVTHSMPLAQRMGAIYTLDNGSLKKS